MRKIRLDRTGLIVILVLAVVGAGAVYWYSQRPVEVEFELRIRSESACTGEHPKYGTISDSLTLNLRDSDNKLIKAVEMRDESPDPNFDCVMVGTASVPRKDVYRVEIESWGTTSDAGLLDWDDIKHGNATLISP